MKNTTAKTLLERRVGAMPRAKTYARNAAGFRRGKPSRLETQFP
jgi:hypothetical protein